MRWKHIVENLKKNKFNVWLLPNMFGKKQTRWYIYTWVLFSTHVWILTHMYGKRHTCVKKATQLYVWKCLAFSTHVWEKPLTCLFPPELSVFNLYTLKRPSLHSLITLLKRSEDGGRCMVYHPAKHDWLTVVFREPGWGLRLFLNNSSITHSGFRVPV